MESGRKSNGSTVSFKSLEEDGFQSGAGTCTGRAKSFPTFTYVLATLFFFHIFHRLFF